MRGRSDVEEFRAIQSILPLRTLGVVERERLYGRGLGWIDVHLLASARLSGATLWTHDGRLAKIASALNLAFEA